MSAAFYHLAQFNIARMLGETVDSPIMAGFASRVAALPVWLDAQWWIPAGHHPTVQEVVERLEHLRRYGPSPAAFCVDNPFPAPDAPTAATGTAPLDLNNRIFTTASNSANGDASARTHFHYRQSGSRVWATYQGGRIRFGTLTAVWTAAGQLDMRYQHTDEDAVYRTGQCTSTPVSESPIVLDEHWQWTNGDGTCGQSRLIEVMPATQEKFA